MANTDDVGSWTSPRKLVECRICHDEDQNSNMETPCSCSGSLKYAHRRCVQRWCNEKGDTICEICRQGFKPGYTAPSPLSLNGAIARNFRGGWEISRRELPNTEFIAMVSVDGDFMDPDFDEYPSPSSRSLICCRIVAIIFIVLLVLRHTLPVIISGTEECSPTLFMVSCITLIFFGKHYFAFQQNDAWRLALLFLQLLILRVIGILLPILIMAKAFTAVLHCRHQQKLPSSNGHSKISWILSSLPLNESNIIQSCSSLPPTQNLMLLWLLFHC